jgi:hypothetical protein
MSSEVQFLDIVYLGIFVILSPAFDSRFYSKKGPATLTQEAAYAVRHFESLLHTFSVGFIILHDGVPVAHSYIVDRMLAEFAAASVVFAKAIPESQEDDVQDGVSFSAFAGSIKGILQKSYPHVFSYYSRCLESGHKHFTWKGPKFMIFPRTEYILGLIDLGAKGELLDLPKHSIYSEDLDQDVTPANTIAPIGKRRDPGEDADAIDPQPKKQKR